ncbi:single-strand DNA-binding protein [Mycoplasmoides fastidiosum]|uniref:Single-stranded DNA-binding protein n=1 Tax=Mycoplasmoides fastidiosum TaxID=92758 RepID=A0ABU0LZV5_9BACT|nr:single-stranded DNA-binding protein [Mycoplasmoides fastidiosum]MDQ0514214.1 single-strand DNA-binding protein [Mycoplasmoides fastidiosum]UUD37377.1 single-stranded DNA-binding protein [Mycoplasmoides fastidiosum]
MLPKVYLIGNLSQDPVMGMSNSGVKYARISVACSGIPTKNNPKPPANYFSMAVWRGTAEFVEKYLKKGDGVFIEGNLTVRTYTNSDGRVVYSTEISVIQLQVTNRRSGGFGNNQANNYSNASSSNYKSYDKETPVNQPVINDYNNFNDEDFTGVNVPSDESEIVSTTKINYQDIKPISYSDDQDEEDASIYDELFS